MTPYLEKAGFDPRKVEPCGTGLNGVMILGEAPGEAEADTGIPFFPGAQAGSVLERGIRRLAMTREQFVITNTVPYRPPKNWLDGAPWEDEAIHESEADLARVLSVYRPRCILALGGIACRATTGLVGAKLGISNLTGYVLPSKYGVPVVPCFHPSFLRRGAQSQRNAKTGEKAKRGGMALFGVLLRCLRLAVAVAKGERQPIIPNPDSPPPGYILKPTEVDAHNFRLETIYRASTQEGFLAYDIETPYSTNEDDAEERAGEILSIQFSLAQGTGIFLPWREPYAGIARQILSLPIPKIGWNNWRFDDPRLRANKAHIAGEIYDLMWAWHHAQPDLPRGLQFAAAMQGPTLTKPTHVWPFPWKHLDNAHPEFYGIVDVDVLQWMVSNEKMA